MAEFLKVFDEKAPTSGLGLKCANALNRDDRCWWRTVNDAPPSIVQHVGMIIKIGDKRTKLTRTSYGFSIESQNLRK
jgi:hypothetical protein